MSLSKYTCIQCRILGWFALRKCMGWIRLVVCSQESVSRSRGPQFCRKTPTISKMYPKSSHLKYKTVLRSTCRLWRLWRGVLARNEQRSLTLSHGNTAYLVVFYKYNFFFILDKIWSMQILKNGKLNCCKLLYQSIFFF